VTGPAPESSSQQQKRAVLSYLHEAHNRAVPVIAVPQKSEGRAVVVLRPERGPADAADPLWASSRLDPSVVRQLADEGYIDTQRTHTPDVSHVLILAKGLRVVGDPVEGVEPDPGAALTPEQRLLLQTVFDHFHEEGDWLKYRQLGRQLVGELDVQQVAQSLPPGHINADEAHHASSGDIEHSEAATLTVPAIRLCDGSESDLSDFIRVLRLCVRRHFDSSNLETPKLSRQDLEQELDMPDLTIRKMIRLIVQEPGIYAGGLTEMDSPSWWMNISEGVSRYKGVQSIDEYIDRRPVPYYTGLPRRPFGYPLQAASASGASRIRGVSPHPILARLSQLSMVSKAAIFGLLTFIGLVLTILTSLASLGWLDDLRRLIPSW